MNKAHKRFKVSMVALAVIGALSMVGAERARAQTAVGGCDTYDPTQGQTVTCSTTGSNPDSKGVQAPQNTTVNNVTVNIEPGVVLNINGSTVGLGNTSTVTNQGTLNTRSFFNGYGISSGVNGRSGGGGNIFLNDTSGVIETGGTNAAGLVVNATLASSAGNSVTNRGSITTLGSSADGIRLISSSTQSIENVVNNTSTGIIRTSGALAQGINVRTTATRATVVNDGEITVTGAGSYGVYITGAAELTVSGTISSSDTYAVYFDPTTSNTLSNTVTLQSGASLDGGIAFDSNKTSEKLVFDGFVADSSASFDNTIIGVNLIDAINNANVVLGASGYSFGTSSITVDGTSTLQIDGVIADGTTLTKLGQGDLILNAANLMSSAVTVSAGVLQLNNNLAAGTGQISIAAGASLKIGANSLNLSNNIGLTGAGTIATQANNVTLTGLITGGSFSKTGLGVLTLDNGSNTYSGGTTITEGTLALTQNNSAGTGAITISNAALQAGADALNIGNAIVLQSAASQVATGDFDTTLSGVISGAGGLTKSGAGKLTLTQANTFTGGSTVNAGTLSLSNNTAAGTGQITIGDAVLEAGAASLNIANAIALSSSNSRVATGNFDTTLSGAVSGVGQLVKTGSGVLTLTGANTYSGGTSVSAGTLALGSGAYAGSGSIALASGTTLQAIVAMTLSNAIGLSGDATLATGTNAVTASGVVSGSGKLIKTGTAALTLTGANSYSGGTELQAGTIVVAADAALGTGALEANGSGVVLQAGKPNLTLANAVTLSTDLIVDTAGELVLLNGDVTGAGRLIKRGTGTLELAGNNAYTGGTEVEAGTLALDVNAAVSTGELIMAADTVVQADTSLALSNVFKLRGPVQFNTQGFDLTLNGRVSNNSVGQLIKTGSGTLTLNGANDYSGGTIVQQGTLALYGTLASGVEVQSGAVFGGTGTVTGTVTNAGTIQPRLNGARSTLTVVGNYVGQGGTFASTLGGTTAAIEADQLAIQGAGNTASGTTTVTVSDPTGVLGQPTVGDGILLVGVTAGATSTATAFSAPRIAAGAYEYTLVRGGASSAESWYLRADIDEPQPEVIVTPEAAQREEVALYPSLPSLARQYLWSINGTLDDRRGAPDVIGQWAKQPIAWARLIAQHNEFEPDNVNNGPGLKANDWGLQLGADVIRSDTAWGQWRAGPVVTIGRSTGSAYNTTGSVNTGSVSLNAYSLGLNATVASHEGAYADLLLLGTRLTGLNANSPLGTSINTTGWAFSGSLEGGWRLPITSNLAITPQAQVYTTTVNLQNSQDAYSLIEMPTQTTVLGRLGLKLSYDNVDAVGPRTLFWARASVFSTLSSKDAETTFLNVAGTNPTTFQSAAPSTWLAIDAAVNVQATENTSIELGIGYQTSFNNQYRGVSGQVNVRFAF